MVLDGVTWGDPFYIGYRIVNGTDYNYGYAELVADYQGGQTRIMVNGWAYESAANDGITVAPVPEPGVIGLLLLGAVGLFCRRLLRRRE